MNHSSSPEKKSLFCVWPRALFRAPAFHFGFHKISIENGAEKTVPKRPQISSSGVCPKGTIPTTHTEWVQTPSSVHPFLRDMDCSAPEQGPSHCSLAGD